MKVRVEDIGPEGLELAFEMSSVKPVDLGCEGGAIVTAPLASVRLTRSGSTVRARGNVDAELNLVCSRCLADCPYTLAADLDLYFRPQPRQQAAEVRLEGEELDVRYYQAGEIDLGEALAEEISLALPMAPLCREDCEGLCPSCGRPLKEGRCDCRGKEIDPRLAKLASWTTE